jgi:hypothetical protein
MACHHKNKDLAKTVRHIAVAMDKIEKDGNIPHELNLANYMPIPKVLMIKASLFPMTGPLFHPILKMKSSLKPKMTAPCFIFNLGV